MDILGVGIDLPLLLGAAFVFGLRVIDVTLGTVRLVLTVRGQRLAAGVMGFFEVTIFLVAISQVLAQIGNWVNIVAYAGGFATGTIVGITLEERLALGTAVVRVVSSRKGREVGKALREAGYGVTELLGVGGRRRVRIANVVARRREVPRILRTVEDIDHEAFITVEGARAVYRGWRTVK